MSFNAQWLLMSEHMSELELINLVQSQLSNAELFSETIDKDREEALDLYNMRPLGNEQEGRSQVSTSDVLDTVEWIIPQIIELFIDDAVDFVPMNEEDIAAAKQETAYTRYVIEKKNEGFLLLYIWLKDALLQKNGIVKAFWDEIVAEETETYENVGEAEKVQLLEPDDVEVIEVITFINGEEVSEDNKSLEGARIINSMAARQQLQQDPEIDSIDETALPVEVTHNVTLKRTKNNSQVTIQNIAPEHFFIQRDYNSIDVSGADFTAHVEEKTVLELKAEGFDPDLVDSIPSGSSPELGSGSINRFEDVGGVSTESFEDPDNRTVWVTEAYIRVDFNEDGVAEMRKVILGGVESANIILLNEEIDSNPFIATTPIIQPHVFWGKSMADLVGEIQKIRTVLWRGMLDNLYMTNDPRFEVVEGQVNMADVLQHRPGLPIRSKRLGSIQALPTPFTAAASASIMPLIDDMSEKRTGVGKNTVGLDSDALAGSTNFVGAKIMSASQGRIRMIARIFGETGYKKLMLKVHELVRKYEDNSKIAKLNGEYVSVNPREWRERVNLEVNVGTGTTDKNAKLLALDKVMTLQQTAIQGGLTNVLVNVENLKNTLDDFQKLSGLGDVGDRYFMNPADATPPEEKPDEAALAAIQIAKADIEQRDAASVRSTEQKAAQSEGQLQLDREKMMNQAIQSGKELEFDKQKERNDVAAEALGV